uniref:TetR/AcrR family transcriptional regulator n=1 Tax=Gordonia sp. B7-2 TaxID=3420932 RepID=UPI003D8C5020
MTTGSTSNARERPLRADAERNRLRIIATARELFAERGLDVSLDDVAAAAGVGVGTVYRRFANRDELIVGVFVEHLKQVSAQVAGALEDPDPWAGVVNLMTWFGTITAGDRGLAAIIMRIDHTDPEIEKVKAGMNERIQLVFDRAQAAGVLRPDLASTDFFALFTMLSSVAEVTEPTVPGVWRRYLELILAGIRAGSEQIPFTVPALSEVQIRAVQRDRAQRRRTSPSG